MVGKGAARSPTPSAFRHGVPLLAGLLVPLLLVRAQTTSSAPAALPTAATTYFAAGQGLLAQGRPKMAEAEIRAGLKLAPRNIDGLNLLALALEEQKDFAGAVEVLQKALKIDPHSTSTELNLTQAYLGAGQKGKGLEIAHALSEQAKIDVRTHFTLGVLLAKQRQYGEAIREFETADALQPDTFETLYNLGQAYRKGDDNQKALEVLGRALEVSPNSVETLYLIASMDSGEGKDLDALELLVKAHKLAPRNTDVIFLMARLSMKQSFYEDAIPLLEEGLKVAPRRPDLLAALGECYFMTGKVENAEDTFHTLIQVDPSARSFGFMALCYRHLGRFEEAVKYLRQGLRADPHDVSCLYNLGYIASRQGQYDLGEKWLKQALAVAPNYTEALLELADLKMRQKKFEEALPLLRKCAQLDPRPAPVYYRLAAAERSLNQTEAAERDLKVFQTLSRDPNPLPAPFQNVFADLEQRANLPLRQRARLDVQQLEQEVKVHSGNPQNFYFLAEAYLKLGRVEDAMQAIAQSEQLSQGDFRTLVEVGVLLARYRLYRAAMVRFQAAVQSNPNSDDAWYDLAEASFRQRDYTAALAAAQHISPQGRKDASYLALAADILTHLGQTDEAIKLLREEITENPDQDRAYFSLALVHLRSGNTAGARETLQHGLARTPDAGELLWGMGVLSVMEGQTKKAEQYLEKSVDMLPEWPGSYSALGVFYFETGQIEKAREILERFRQAGPRGALDVERIEQGIDAAAVQHVDTGKVQGLSPEAQQQFLKIALAFADQAP